MLRIGIDGMGDDHNRTDIEEAKHRHIPKVNDEKVGVEYRVLDPNQHWKKLKHEVGECYESLTKLRFALTNYDVHNGYQIYFENCDRVRIIARCGKNSNDPKPCPFRVATGWK